MNLEVDFNLCQCPLLFMLWKFLQVSHIFLSIFSHVLFLFMFIQCSINNKVYCDRFVASALQF